MLAQLRAGAGGGEEEAAGGPVGGPDDLGLAALPLELGDGQLRGVPVVELHWPDYVGLVGAVDCRVDPGLVGGPGGADRVEQDPRGRVAVGDVLRVGLPGLLLERLPEL